MSQKHSPKVLCEKGILKNFAKCMVKHLCESIVFNKVSGLKSATLMKSLQHSCFPEKFAKLLRTTFYVIILVMSRYVSRLSLSYHFNQKKLHKTFIRCPRLLVNVLCTFNFGPVSRAITRENCKAL